MHLKLAVKQSKRCFEDEYAFFPFSEAEWKTRHPQLDFPASNTDGEDDEEEQYIDESRSLLGEGNFGRVYRMQTLSDKSVVAVKFVARMGKPMADLKKEPEFLQKLKHDNIIEFRDLMFSTRDMHLIMEFAETSLARAYQHDYQDEKKTVKLVKGIASALDYMHGRGVIHRDLKLENILIQDGEAKVTDFGCASQLNSSISLRGSLVGSIIYFSPERITEQYGWPADMWAVGCIIWEVLARQRVKSDFWREEKNISQMVLDCEKISHLLARQVSQLLQLDPLKRISALTLRVQLDDPSKTDHLTLPPFRWNLEQLAGLERQEAGAGLKVTCYSVVPGAERRAQRLMDSVVEYVESSHPANRGVLQRDSWQLAGVTALDSEGSSQHFRQRIAKLQASAAEGWKRPPFSPDWDEPAFTRYPGEDKVEQTRSDIEWRQGVKRLLDSRPDRLGTDGDVRVHTVFHACRDRATALRICAGGFWSLSLLDPGFYGKGLYFAGELDYALWYGRNMLADGCATATPPSPSPHLTPPSPAGALLCMRESARARTIWRAESHVSPVPTLGAPSVQPPPPHSPPTPYPPRCS